MRLALRWKIGIRRRSERKREGRQEWLRRRWRWRESTPDAPESSLRSDGDGTAPNEAAVTLAAVQESDLDKAERFVREREVEMEQQRELVVGFRRDGGSTDGAVNRLRGLYDLLLEGRKNLARLQHRERQAAPRKVAKPTPRPPIDRSVETRDGEVVFPGER